MLYTDSGSGRAGDLAAELGGEALDSNAELAERADVVVLAVKPARLEEVAAELDGARTVVSLLGATPLARVEAAFPGRRRDPGDAQRRRRGRSAASSAWPAPRRPRCGSCSGCSAMSSSCPTRHFDAATAVMGCAPAYLALAVEALADAGADAGLDEELARELVVETTAGTAELLRIRHPSDVRAAVASPGRQHRGGPRGARRRRRPRGVRGRGQRLAGEDERPVIALAMARADVADYVSALFLVYSILILLNILIGWIPRMPFYSRWFRAVLDFVTETTDPYLNVFRRLVPSVGGGGMAFSFAPVIALIVLFVVEAVVVGLIRG